MCDLFSIKLYNYLKIGKKKQTSDAKIAYILRRFSHIKENCINRPVVNTPNTGPIWVCWWQGEDNMPILVKQCYKRLLNAAPVDRNVILITKYNYDKYADIPDYILRKVEKKIISITHLSDILRMTLLAKHGGLWIDSTVFIPRDMPDYVFKHPYFSARAPYSPQYISRCAYTGFLLAATKNAPWITYTRDVLLEYWKKANILIDYVFVDCILISGFDNISAMRENISLGIVDTPYLHKLEAIFNEPCNTETYDKMMRECSFFKLSFKLKFYENTPDGKLTYYGHWLKLQQNLN